MDDIEKTIVALTSFKNSLNLFDLVTDAFERENLKEYVIKKNQEQLFKLGEDSEDDSLGEYSAVTVEHKKALGLPYDRITLKETGAFFSTITIILTKTGIEFTANPIKKDEETGEETDLFREFGKDIVGLNKKNTQLFIRRIKRPLTEALIQRKNEALRLAK